MARTDFDNDEVLVEGELDDGLVDIDALTEEEGEAPKVVRYDINAANMVPEILKSGDLGQKAIRTIADFVYKEVKSAWDSQEKYRKNAREQWKMFAGDLPAKNFPFKNAANAHVPMLLEDATRLYMRIYVELFGNNFDEVFSVLPVGPDDHDVAEILSRHGNWQLANELLSFPAEMERCCLFFIIPGDVTAHSYYDAHKRHNCHEILTPDDVIVPYVHKTTQPDYSDCPWVGKWLRMFRYQLQRYRGEWHDVDAVLAKEPSFDEDEDSPLADEQKRMDGNEPDDDQRAPYKFIHYEGWIKLPEQKDEYFCKVVMEWRSKQVMLLQLLMEDDWKDKKRYDMQANDLQAYLGALQQSRLPPQPALDPATGAPMMDPMTGGLAMQPPAPPPPPPPWAEDPAALEDPAFELEPVRQVPIHMFVHGKGIEPPAGPLGVGLGKVLTDLNKAANTVLSQFIDQGTLANSWSGVIAGTLTNGKEIVLEAGKFTPLPGASPRDIQDGIKEISPRAANPQMTEMLALFRNYSEGASTAPSVLSGEAGKSGETYRGLQMRIDQATKQISFLAGKIARFVKKIIENNARLNSHFMPEQELLYINNHKAGTSQELQVGRKLYDRDYRVSMSSDLRFASQAARVAEADQVYAIAQTPVQGLPPNLPFIQAAMKNVLIARGQDQMVRFLGPDMPPPPMPLGLPTPEQQMAQQQAAMQQQAQQGQGQKPKQPPQQPTAPQPAQPPAPPSQPPPGENVVAA